MQRSLLSFVLFVAIFSAIVGACHYYLWYRLVRSPDLSLAWQRIGTWTLCALAALLPVSLLATPSLPRRVGTILSGFVYSWLGLMMLLVFLLFASEIVRVAVHAASAAAAKPLDIERRTLLSRGIAAVVGVVGVGLAGVGAASALGDVAIRSVRVSLRRLPQAMSGFRVVQLSDVHIGPTIGRDWLAAVVATVNAQTPDLIVITGDLVDGPVEALREHVAPLAALRAKHGVYFVTGNHEYYSGVDEWLNELTRLGIRVLRNERVSIGEGEHTFDLAGVDDWSAKRLGGGHGPDLERALAGRDPARELLLLAHQPKQILEAAARGVGLQLSGHTHGGQIFPWNFFVRLDQPYIAGLSRHDDTLIYVSRGTGYWGPPMRVGAPSEITLLELMSGAVGDDRAAGHA